MHEMVDKVKKGEPLYGHSTLSPYLQGVAARNSRYSGFFIHVLPWANFVNHNQVSGVPVMRSSEKALLLDPANNGPDSTASTLQSTINKRRGNWPQKMRRKRKIQLLREYYKLEFGHFSASLEASVGRLSEAHKTNGR